MTRTVFHVDLDAFYASVETREHPGWRGKPVIVGSDPKEGRGRGVVMACSYEARRRGVHSGQPISQAYRLCADAIYTQPNFALYERASENVMRLLHQFADRVEAVSIDEAYLDVTARVEPAGGAAALAGQVKQEILRREGLTCSIGVGPNKLVAKIATVQNKPNGLTIVDSGEVRRFLNPLPVQRIPGVGVKTQARLAERGIQTIGDLAATSLERLTGTFGRTGLWLWQAANGIDDSEVVDGWEPKSLSAESTFEHDVRDRERVRAEIRALAEEVHRRLKADGYQYRTVGLKLRFVDFETHTRAKSLTDYTDRLDKIQQYAAQLLEDFGGDPRRIRLVGVRVAGLRRLPPEQATLLRWAEAESPTAR